MSGSRRTSSSTSSGDIIERLWKGRQERVRRGLPPGGNAAYGFRRGGQGLTPDETEVSIVQEIFALAAQGIRAPAIAKSLNAKGLVRRNGKPWTQRQVNAVLIG